MGHQGFTSALLLPVFTTAAADLRLPLLLLLLLLLACVYMCSTTRSLGRSAKAHAMHPATLVNVNVP
jgi:hypothetical protein